MKFHIYTHAYVEYSHSLKIKCLVFLVACEKKKKPKCELLVISVFNGGNSVSFMSIACRNL